MNNLSESLQIHGFFVIPDGSPGNDEGFCRSHYLIVQVSSVICYQVSRAWSVHSSIHLFVPPDIRSVDYTYSTLVVSADSKLVGLFGKYLRVKPPQTHVKFHRRLGFLSRPDSYIPFISGS